MPSLDSVACEHLMSQARNDLAGNRVSDSADSWIASSVRPPEPSSSVGVVGDGLACPAQTAAAGVWVSVHYARAILSAGGYWESNART